METIEIRIDSLSYGGAGVGRAEGIVHFVPFSCPGDLLEIKITRREKRYREAEIVRIIEASPDRVNPPCPYFGTCGGCQWQHVDYKSQLESKEKELKSALVKSRLGDCSSKVLPVIPSPAEYGYRRTARFKIGKKGKDGAPEAGFFKTSSHDLVGIEKCLLLDDALNNGFKDTDINKTNLVGFDLFLDDGKVVPFYRFSEHDIGADFFQANGEVNKIMMNYIRKIVAEHLKDNPRILDLFCGDGNLSLQFAETAASITGWDNSKTAIQRGKMRAEKMKEAGIKCRIRYHEADVDRSWKFISGHAREADCIIIDPPRRGLKKQAARLAGLKVPLIIYVSCSPPALTRDLAMLTEAGYQVEELQPLDMFPQTYHLETVAVLKRKNY